MDENTNYGTTSQNDEKVEDVAEVDEVSIDSEKSLLKPKKNGLCASLSPSHKKLVVLSVVVSLILIICMVSLAFPNEIKKLITGSNAEICQSKACKDEAKTLVSRMDKSIDPCDNFYEFSCGNWLKKVKIEPSKQTVSMFSELGDIREEQIIRILEAKNDNDYSNSLKAAKSFYGKCMDLHSLDKQGIQPIKDVLKDIFGSSWPVLDASWSKSSIYDDDLAFIKPQILAKMITHGLSPLMNLEVEVNIKNTSSFAITLDQLNPTDFGMDWISLLNITATRRDENNTLAYVRLMKRVVTIMNGGVMPSSEHKFDEEIRNILFFEIKLAKIVDTNISRDDLFNLYYEVPIAQLEQDLKIPGVLFEMIKSSVPKNVKIDENTKLYVPGKNYLIRLLRVLQETPTRDVINYLQWMVVRKLGTSSTNDLNEAHFQYSKATEGIKAKTDRNITCSKMANELFAYALAGEYVKKDFPKQAKEDLNDMMDNILSSFEERIKSLSWMDSKTREKALLKADKMLNFIAYPDWILDNKEVDKYYSKINSKLSISNSLVKDIYDTSKEISDYSFSKLNDVSERNSWDEMSSTTPLDINADYNPTSNSIRILAGILGGAFYNHERPAVMNYGGIGAVMGHEITHGFDNQGRKFDEVGNLNNWWEKKTSNAYDNLTHCFVKQYNKIYDKQTSLTLSGDLNIGENIADNGGIRHAFNAYQKWVEKHGEIRLGGLEKYSGNQLFFISFANAWCNKMRTPLLRWQIMENEHSPSKYRVNVASSNFDEFAKAFQCKPGTKMNPKDRCIVW